MPDEPRVTTLISPRVLTISPRYGRVPMRFAQPGTVALLIAGADGAATIERIAEAGHRG